MDWQRIVFCWRCLFSCFLLTYVCVMSSDKAVTEKPENANPTNAEWCDKPELLGTTMPPSSAWHNCSERAHPIHPHGTPPLNLITTVKQFFDYCSACCSGRNTKLFTSV